MPIVSLSLVELRRGPRDHAQRQRAAHAGGGRADPVHLRRGRAHARAAVPDQLGRAVAHRGRRHHRRGERHRRAGGEVVRGRAAAARRARPWPPAACGGASIRQVDVRARYAPAAWRRCRGSGLAAVLLYGGLLAIDGTVTVGTLVAFSTYVVLLQAPVPDARVHAACSASGRRRRPTASTRSSTPSPTSSTDRAPSTSSSPRGEVDLARRDVPLRRGRPGARAPRPPPRRRARRVALDRPHRERQVDDRPPAAALLRRVATARCCVDGHDVRDLTVRSLRAAIGLVLDEPFLFSATVRENIAYGRPDATDDEVRAAARAAGAEEFIDALPEGFDSEVGERGYTLSGGQRQRDRHRPDAPRRPRHPDPRRRHQRHRRAGGGGDPRRAPRAHGGPHDAGDRPPHLDHQPGRARRAARGRPHRRRRHPRRADGHRAALRRGARPHRGDRRRPPGARRGRRPSGPPSAPPSPTRDAPPPKARRPRETCL